MLVMSIVDQDLEEKYRKIMNVIKFISIIILIILELYGVDPFALPLWSLVNTIKFADDLMMSKTGTSASIGIKHSQSESDQYIDIRSVVEDVDDRKQTTGGCAAP